jgi:hypothetical protein
MNLTPEYFQSLVNFQAANQLVRNRIGSLKNSASLLRFFVGYTSWNGHFANGVTILTSLIGRNRGLFVEQGLPRALADRSNFVASYFFDAVRDEYDDHINPKRDSHRCLAQATLMGMAEILGTGTAILEEEESSELRQLNAEVLDGYTGGPVSKQGVVAQIFFGMGYHLGSELLADREFSIIDETLRENHNDLVQQLMRKTVYIAGTEHRCYAWIGVHSGHGGGVEADHFDYAVQGVKQGLKYLPPNQHAQALEALKLGFLAFAANHHTFFNLP